MERDYGEWSHPNVINFYTQHRCNFSDLYESEKFFLPKILFPNIKVLDIGCAAGGFYNIIKTIEPTVEYTGVDISLTLIEKARKKYPGVKFLTANVTDIPFDDSVFDLVFSTGVLHMEYHYYNAIKEAYRVTDKHLLFDLRLNKDETGFFTQKLIFENNSSYSNKKNEIPSAPYIVCNATEILDFLKQLSPVPISLQATGYFRKPAETVSTKQEVCMTAFLIEKGKNGHKKTCIQLDLPLKKLGLTEKSFK